MKARDIYEGSDGSATKLYYTELEKSGPIGTVAVNLFRAQKCSARAKIYRGGIRGQGSFKRMAYERKAWALANLCNVLYQIGPQINIGFGWKEDPLAESFAQWVLYVDLPNGQVSFHSVRRYPGPDYPGDWDGLHLSCDRILEFCDAVMNPVPGAIRQRRWMEPEEAIVVSCCPTYCPTCRGTREEPLEFWASPTDGLVCIDPFHASKNSLALASQAPVQGELF